MVDVKTPPFQIEIDDSTKEEFDLDIRHYDSPLAVHSTDAKTYAYFAASRKPATPSQSPDGRVNRDLMGTYGIELSGSDSLASARAIIEDPNNLLREYSGRPHRVVAPISMDENAVDEESADLVAMTTVHPGEIHNTSFSTRTVYHGFAQCEDFFYRQANIFDEQRYSYGRILYFRGHTPKHFTHHRYRDAFEDGIQEDENNITPTISHWQGEEICRADSVNRHPITGDEIPYQPMNPLPLMGTTPPTLIPVNEYYYLFYGRQMDLRQQNYNPYWAGYPTYGYPEGISNEHLPLYPTVESEIPAWNDSLRRYFSANICVARCLRSELDRWSIHKSYNPFKKYYKKYEDINAIQFDGTRWKITDGTYREGFTEDGNGGLDTSLMPESASFGKITYHEGLQRFLCVCQVYVNHENPRALGLYWTDKVESFGDGEYDSSVHAALINWHGVSLLPMTHNRYSYPTLVCGTGTSEILSEDTDTSFLYCSSGIFNWPTEIPVLTRRTIKFSE